MNDRPIERQARLTPAQIDNCLLHMIRAPELFDEAKRELQPSHFDRDAEMYYALVWGATLEVAERNGGKLPEAGTQAIIEMEMHARIDRAAPEVPAMIATAAQKLLNWIFSVDAVSLNPSYYRPYIRDLVIERKFVNTMAKDIAMAQSLGRPLDLPRLLQENASKMQSVMIDPTRAAKSAFPLGIRRQTITKFTTGIPWLDEYMNGGQAGGEVYGLLGPTGLGKTTLAVMLVVEGARYWARLFRTGVTTVKKISHLVSWEQDYDRIVQRVWAYAARIHSNSLEKWVDEIAPEPLSTTGNLKEYELKEFENEIAQVGKDNWPGETERLEAAAQELDEFLKVDDFSGYDEMNPTAGQNGIDDVATLIKAFVNKGYGTGVVALDYANVAIRRMMAAKGVKLDNMRHVIGSWGDECRYKIASPFNCPVWALNQLNTEANRRAPTAEQHHSYSSEAGNFAENMWFAFVFGTKDRETNTAHLWCSKERRAKGNVEPPILEIRGQFCQMIKANDRFQADSQLRRIVPRDMAQRFVDPRSRARRPSDGPPPSGFRIRDV